MKSMFTMSLALGLLALAQTAPQAATLQVKHNPGSGQYGKIMDAVNAAQSGDVIEIIDNSAPFDDPIVYKKGDDTFTLTVRGKADLNPRPTLKPIAANAITSPYDGGVKPIITGNGIITVENLIIDGSDTAFNLPVDLRFNKKGTINNIKLTSTKNEDIFTWLSEQDNTVTNCDFTMGKPFYHNGKCTLNVSNTKLTFTGFGIWVRGGTPVLNMDKVTVTGGGNELMGGTTTITNSNIENGTNIGANNNGGQPVNVTFDQCTINGPGTNVLGFPNAATVGNPAARDGAGTVNATLNRTIVTTHNKDADNNLIVVNQGIDQINFTLTNCDLVGNPVDKNSSSGILYGNCPSADNTLTAQTTAHNTIFYNLKAAAFALINGSEADPSGIHEDYNVYKAANPFINGPASTGANDKILADTDALYIDVVNSNLKLDATSPAATINPTGTPKYAGSQGVEGAVNASRHWAVFE